MTLEAKDKLISDMIKENPDVTIRQYLDVVKELEEIEQAQLIRLPVRYQGRDQNGRFQRIVWI
jgi:hypothetical protein